MYDIYELNEKSLVELKEIALQLGIENINHTKEELVYSIIDHQAIHPDIISEKKTTEKKARRPRTVKDKTSTKGKKVATSMPGKKEDTEEVTETKITENELTGQIKKDDSIVEVKEDVKADSGEDKKSKREKRPRIGKRTDVVKTTIDNDIEQDKVQHVSYTTKKNTKKDNV